MSQILRALAAQVPRRRSTTLERCPSLEHVARPWRRHESGRSRRCSPASMIGELLKTKLQVGHLLSVCTTCATQIEQQIAWPHSKRISRGSSSQMMHTREVSGGGVADGTIAACEGTREGGGACGEGGGGCGEARGACGEAGGGCQKRVRRGAESSCHVSSISQPHLQSTFQ